MKNIFKKIIALMPIVYVAALLIAPNSLVFAQAPCAVGYVIVNNTCVREGSYQLLAPLPEVNENFDPGQPNALGAYLNVMIKLFIGLCAVLAVVMIIYGGMEYMTSELISSKEHGKNRITGAIFGLILALGAYALLFTINPDLLNTDIKIDDAKITVTLEQESVADAITRDAGATPTGALSRCSAGIKKSVSGIFACGGIANNIDNMIRDARNSGLTIHGGGYRSLEQQKQLRIRNCSGDYTDQNAKCSPPTAVPGLSNHNNGLAFDLTCNGVLIQHQTNACFIWLKANASKYGLQNFAREPWHWSVDGR